MIAMSSKEKTMSVFEQIKSGFQDSIAHSRGELSLATTELPAPPGTLQPNQIAKLRQRYSMSQAVFAAVLNVSKKTVQSWEQGARVPSDAALRMLQVIGREPGVVRMIFAAKARPKARPASGQRRVGRLEKAVS